MVVLRRMVLLMVVLALAGAGCTDAEEAATTTTTTSPTAAATTTSAGPAPAPTTSVPLRPPLALDRPLPRPLLLVDEDGVWSLSPQGAFRLLVAGEVALAFDDTLGGVVFQQPWEWGESFTKTSIYRVPPGSGAAEVVVGASDTELVELKAVEVIDGAPTVIYTVGRDLDSPTTATDVLRLRRLDTGADRGLAIVGGWEWGAGRVSHGGDLFAVESFGEAYTWLDILDPSGFPQSFPTSPLPEPTDCFDVASCPVGMVISPDGITLAFTRGVAGGEGNELVIWFLYSGAESWDQIGVAGDPQPRRLDYDGEVVLVTRAGAGLDDYTMPLLVEVGATPWVIHEVPVNGWFSLRRGPVEVAGPITLGE